SIVTIASGSKDIGSMVTAGCKMTIKGGTIGYKIAEAVSKDDKKAVFSILAQVGEAIGTGLEIAGTANNMGKAEANQTQDWSKAAAAVTQLLGAPKIVSKVYEACKSGKPSEAFGAIREAVTAGVGSVITYQVGTGADEI